ncbi:MAG: methyltransferase domain-containing protein [Bacillota bacterium]
MSESGKINKEADIKKKGSGFLNFIQASGIARLMKLFFSSQEWLSRKFDRLFPGKFRVDGHQAYQNRVVPRYLKAGQVVYDIGGGKRPYLNHEAKKRLKAYVVGFDISEEELSRAPGGIYDKIICADISCFTGNREADLVICQSLLEHVKDVDAAISTMSGILKTGGLALVFVPSRNALYARLNRLLPQGLKNKMLSLVNPKMKDKLGFPAYYDRCTPKELKALAKEHNFLVVEEYYYYNSLYFYFFFPFYLLWRLWILIFYLFSREQAAETFTLVLKKNE